MERKWNGKVAIRTMGDEKSKVRQTDNVKGRGWGDKDRNEGR